MSSGYAAFDDATKWKALARQKYHCGSCGTRIVAVGEAGKTDHKFGERAEAHHLIPNKQHGPATVANCVVLCRSCHYSAHRGGDWRDISMYADIKHLPMSKQIATIAALYPHYEG
jgi:predicted restriction endonuclease